MEYRVLPHGGERISVLGMGSSVIGARPEEEIIATVRAAVDAGVNYFDMAGANALLYYNGAAHLLRIGEEILESGMPAIGVHSATTILFEGDYLYACAPDSVCAVNLQNAEVSSQLSFGVG